MPDPARDAQPWMPTPDVAVTHARRVEAAPTDVFVALRTADVTRPWPVRALLVLRALPILLTGRVPAPPPPPPYPHWRVGGLPFALLEDDAPRHLAIGLQGRFWQLDGGLLATPPEGFRAPVPQGVARVLWTFHAVPEGSGTHLHTTTFVACGDPATRRRFLRYWRVVGPFSGLIRRLMLAEVAREARRLAATGRQTPPAE